MADPFDDFNECLQGFYRAPDPARVLRTFETWLKTRQPNVIELYAFARMAAASPEVRAGIERLREAGPAVVDAVLKSFSNPAFPRVAPGPPSAHELDLLWADFFVTGSVEPVLRIVGLLDEPDIVRAKLTLWLRETGTGFFGRRKLEKYAPVFARCAIPVKPDASRIDGPLDLDVSVALAARAGKLKFAELPVPLSQGDALCIAAKSAAVWSLRANAAAHAPIAELCRVEAMKAGGAARPLLGSPA